MRVILDVVTTQTAFVLVLLLSTTGSLGENTWCSKRNYTCARCYYYDCVSTYYRYVRAGTMPGFTRSPRINALLTCKWA